MTTTGRAPRVHQVLATLGYGDAIGHEVLGIQRVLRSAGFDSEIFVETADPRLEPLTLDYRDMIGSIGPQDVLIHHFSIGSRASRTAYALPGRMALDLSQHHAARVFHRRAQGPGQAVFSRQTRAHRLHRPLRHRARRFGLQPEPSSRRSVSVEPTSCRSSPTSRTWMCRPTTGSPRTSTTSG